jgi:uncharacterized membrane protein
VLVVKLGRAGSAEPAKPAAARMPNLMKFAHPGSDWHATCLCIGMDFAKLAQRALGGVLVFEGISHMTFARRQFRAQVPDWVPLSEDTTVLASGVAEIALGASLVLADEARRPLAGKIAAAFFVAVFPGNVSQYVNRRTAFGLDTDTKRFVRLLFQPALVYWALKSTTRNLQAREWAEATL